MESVTGDFVELDELGPSVDAIYQRKHHRDMTLELTGGDEHLGLAVHDPIGKSLRGEPAKLSNNQHHDTGDSFKSFTHHDGMGCADTSTRKHGYKDLRYHGQVNGYGAALGYTCGVNEQQPCLYECG